MFNGKLIIDLCFQFKILLAFHLTLQALYPKCWESCKKPTSSEYGYSSSCFEITTNDASLMLQL